MVGEPSLYLVYKSFSTTERTSNSWYGTQALADDAAIDKGADFSAHQGVVKAPNDWLPGWIYNPTADTWRELLVDDLDTLGKRKYAAHSLYQALDGLAYDASRIVKPSADVARVSDLIAFAKWGVYVVFTADTWTAAEQVAWAESAMRGPTDGESAKTFVRVAHGLAAEYAPESAFTWCNPADAARVALSGAAASSGRWFSGLTRDLTMVDLDGSDWIERLT